MRVSPTRLTDTDEPASPADWATSDGAQIVQQTDTGASSQQWSLVLVFVLARRERAIRGARTGNSRTGAGNSSGLRSTCRIRCMTSFRMSSMGWTSRDGVAGSWCTHAQMRVSRADLPRPPTQPQDLAHRRRPPKSPKPADSATQPRHRNLLRRRTRGRNPPPRRPPTPLAPSHPQPLPQTTPAKKARQENSATHSTLIDQARTAYSGRPLPPGRGATIAIPLGATKNRPLPHRRSGATRARNAPPGTTRFDWKRSHKIITAQQNSPPTNRNSQIERDKSRHGHWGSLLQPERPGQGP
jgi:hypothetical protein